MSPCVTDSSDTGMVLKNKHCPCPKEYMEAAEAAGSYPLCVFNIKIIFTGAAGSAAAGGGGKVNVAHRKTLGWR